ncbi:hypothetical protein [Luteibacter yeojuensis]|uniref:DUF4405 domain-containing protein n=1 Tax=Luteibacter yeojuensis TaxID=345309 RepID=A0A0F3KWP6_9GAMM|nr:hypothetical protein [Luteibacter yeojuensis]KJV35690.1 hypothetical protein VI08_06700 [Luteibacter yeojuensis]
MRHDPPKRRRHGPIRLASGRRLFTWAVGWSLFATGAAWLACHYFLQTMGPFGPRPSPWEPWWLRIHAAFGFMALWTFGMVWSAHIANGWAAGHRRWSGGFAFAVIAGLVITGYLTYYLIDDTWHEWVSLIHWVVGLALPVVVVTHVMRGRKARRKPVPPPSGYP